MRLKSLFLSIIFAATTTVHASIFDKDTQVCVLNQLSAQFPSIGRIEFGGVFLVDDNNWDMQVVTRFPDGGSDRIFVSVKNGDHKNASLLVDGLFPQPFNLEACF